MLPIEIVSGVYWVGVQNPNLRVFDVIMRTEWGTSYNSYLIKGTKKTAVVDAVKDGFADEQIEKIAGVCDPASIDYIICNHTEPDHSGGLNRLLEMAPNAVVVCSKPASIFLRSILNKNFECKIAEDGDTIALEAKRCGLFPRRFCTGRTLFLHISRKMLCCFPAMSLVSTFPQKMCLMT